MKKNLFIIGTRPEIIKVAPLVNDVNSKVLFTGQHFNKNMHYDFLSLFEKNVEILNIKTKNLDLDIQKLIAFENLTEIIEQINPDNVIVQGDTYSTLLGAISAKKASKNLFYIESGMRSGDLTQIEEFIRVTVAHLANINFCNHKNNKLNLLNEGINKSKIVQTGSTVYAALNSTKLLSVDVKQKNTILLTLHRPENVDNSKKLFGILNTLDNLNLKILFPVHPRTEAKISDYKNRYENIRFIKPLNYQKFIKNLKECKFVISDSGGLQEECAILKKPLLIPRQFTERPEMLNKFNILVKNNTQLKKEISKLLKGTSSISDPDRFNLLYGKDEVVKKIANYLT